MTSTMPDLLSKILSLSKYFTEISRTRFLGGISNRLQWKLGTYQSLGAKLFPLAFLSNRFSKESAFSERLAIWSCAVSVTKVPGTGIWTAHENDHRWTLENAVARYASVTEHTEQEFLPFTLCLYLALS